MLGQEGEGFRPSDLGEAFLQRASAYGRKGFRSRFRGLGLGFRSRFRYLGLGFCPRSDLGVAFFQRASARCPRRGACRGRGLTGISWPA